jgi:hypothetical protein
MYMGLSEIINRDEQSTVLLGAYHNDISVAVTDE